MTLREQIQQDMKDAMRAREQKRLDVIRLLLAAIKQQEVDKRITLDDTQILVVIEKMIKQRHDSISYYQTAGRQELVNQENFEIVLLENYLPAQLSEQEIEDFITHAINETNASSIRDMGKVMAILKSKIQGQADMTAVSNQVKRALEAKRF